MRLRLRRVTTVTPTTPSASTSPTSAESPSWLRLLPSSAAVVAR